MGDASAMERVPGAVAVAKALEAEAGPERAGVALAVAVGESELPGEGEIGAEGVRWAVALATDADAGGVTEVNVELVAQSVAVDVRLAEVELEGQAVGEAERATEALALGEPEEEAHSDPRLLPDWERETEVVPEAEVCTDREDPALLESVACAVAELVALGEVEPAAMEGLSTAEKGAERVMVLLAESSKLEADALPVVLPLRDGDSDGDVEALPVASKL